MLVKILLHLTISTYLVSVQAQVSDVLYFPEDSHGPLATDNRAALPAHVNLDEIRGTTAYEKYVDRVIAGGIANLTLAIDRALLQGRNSQQDNLVFAPMSIGGALALVLLGSNGKTFEEITTVLGLTTGLDVEQKSELVHEHFGRMISKLEATAGFELGQQVTFAHAVFVQNNYPIRDLYRQTAEQLYQSEILNVDFERSPNEAQRSINAWVADRTKGKIKDILAVVPPASTKVIIASAMYFKALWEYPFFEGTTRRRPFYTNGRNSPSLIEAEMMANGGTFPYYRDPNLKCEIMGFPYKGNATVMYVVMPFDSNTEKLKEVENSLTAKDLKHLADSTTGTRAIVLFPKMKIESTIDLKAPLEQMGLKSLFNPGQANLALLSPGEGAPVPQGVKARISSSTTTTTLDKLRQLINQQSTNNNYQNPGLYADKVVHKVYMEITETGTEAAASTSVSLSRDGGRVTFRADVPFFFFIRHEETKTLLFWGSVNRPTPHFEKQ